MTSNLDEMYDEMLRGEFGSRGKHAAPDTATASGCAAPARTACTSPRRTRRFTTSSRCQAPPARRRGDVRGERGAEGARALPQRRHGGGRRAGLRRGGRLSRRPRRLLHHQPGGRTPAGLGDHAGPIGRRRRRPGRGRRGIDERHGGGDDRGVVVAVGLAHAERGAVAVADGADGVAAGAPWPTCRVPGRQRAAARAPVASRARDQELGTGSGCTPTTTDLGLGLRPRQPDQRARQRRHAAERPDGDARQPRAHADRCRHQPDRDAGRPGLAHPDRVAPAARRRSPEPRPPRAECAGQRPARDGRHSRLPAVRHGWHRRPARRRHGGGLGRHRRQRHAARPRPRFRRSPSEGAGAPCRACRPARLSSLPVTASAGGTATTPAASGSGSTTTGGTTSTTSTTSTTTTTTTVTVPLPAVPVPVSTPPVSVGGVSVGVSTSGSGSGLTLSLP